MTHLKELANLLGTLQVDKETSKLDSIIFDLIEVAHDLKTISHITDLIIQEMYNKTYKFALIRAIIELSSEYSHFIVKDEKHVNIPMGLVVSKWIEYYYDLYRIEKITVSKFQTVKDHNIEIVLLKDMMRKGSMAATLQNHLTELVKSLREIIWKGPIKHFGGEYSNYFKYSHRLRNNYIFESLLDLIDAFGVIQVEKSFYNCFEKYGHLILGQKTVMLGWANFMFSRYETVNSLSQAFELISKKEIDERNTNAARSIIRNSLNGTDYYVCTWSNQPLNHGYEIDHIIPYSLYYNNDLWNLVPCRPKINRGKSDAIPYKQLEEQETRNRIIRCWEIYYQDPNTGGNFINEIKLSLGVKTEDENHNPIDMNRILNEVYEKLIFKCKTLITNNVGKQWK